ncbi:hypothetical protein MMC12_000993 [Toensbergia leucococca]|nr:hypothetical protein [Toensbergia leucococca]
MLSTTPLIAYQSLDATLPFYKEPLTLRSFQFLALPGEIRNLIYTNLLVVNEHRGFCSRPSRAQTLHSSILTTCRQIHFDCMPILYSCNRFQARLLPDFINYGNGPIITSPRVEFGLQYLSDLSIDIDCYEYFTEEGIRRHLRGICMTLLGSGASLQKLRVLVSGAENQRLDHFPENVDVFGPLKELRPVKRVEICGFRDESCLYARTFSYVEEVKALIEGRDASVPDVDVMDLTTPKLMYKEALRYAEAFLPVGNKSWQIGTVGNIEAVVSTPWKSTLGHLEGICSILHYDRWEQVLQSPDQLSRIDYHKALSLLEERFEHVSRQRNCFFENRDWLEGTEYEYSEDQSYSLPITADQRRLVTRARSLDKKRRELQTDGNYDDTPLILMLDSLFHVLPFLRSFTGPTPESPSPSPPPSSSSSSSEEEELSNAEASSAITILSLFEIPEVRDAAQIYRHAIAGRCDIGDMARRIGFWAGVCERRFRGVEEARNWLWMRAAFRGLGVKGHRDLFRWT